MLRVYNVNGVLIRASAASRVREKPLKMANSESVDLMGLGQHCSIKSCNRLDFLPFKCSKCGETFW